MDATQLIEYLEARRDSFIGTVQLGGGTTVTDPQVFLKSHLEAVADHSASPHIREVHLLRLQRFYDAVTGGSPAGLQE